MVYIDALYYIRLWFDSYWFSGILWMAIIMFVQIYKLLVANKQTKRYQPLARKRVIIDSSIVHIVSMVFAIVFTMVEWARLRHEWPYLTNFLMWWIPYIPTLFIPTLLMAGMCFGVWWNKLLPTKNARYRSLTLYFARLLATAYVMAILSIVLALLWWNFPDNPESESAKIYVFAWQVFSCIFYLVGAFQLYLALAKKDVRVAFVDMWCCRKNGGVHELCHDKDDNCDDDDNDDDDAEPPTVDNTTADPEANSLLDNKDICISENGEAITAFVDTKD